MYTPPQTQQLVAAFGAPMTHSIVRHVGPGLTGAQLWVCTHCAPTFSQPGLAVSHLTDPTH